MDKNFNNKNNFNNLLVLREKIPFLRGIPDDIYFQLDTTEFLIPTKDISEARENLEKKLNRFVMTYKKNVFEKNIPLQSHLCSTIKSAKLTSKEKYLIKVFEKQFKAYNLNFVVYNKPLTFINPKEGPLYDFYQKNGLIPLYKKISFSEVFGK